MFLSGEPRLKGFSPGRVWRMAKTCCSVGLDGAGGTWR